MHILSVKASVILSTLSHMHETLVVETGHDEHRVGFVFAQLHHSVVRVLGKLASAHTRHVPLQVLAQSLTTEDDTAAHVHKNVQVGDTRTQTAFTKGEPVTKSASNPTLLHIHILTAIDLFCTDHQASTPGCEMHHTRFIAGNIYFFFLSFW